MRIEHYRQRLALLLAKIRGIKVSHKPEAMTKILNDLNREVETLMEEAGLDQAVDTTEIVMLETMIQSTNGHVEVRPPSAVAEYLPGDD